MTSIAALPLETSASVPLEPSQPSTVKYEHSDKINEDNTEQFFGPEGIPKSSDESGPSPRVQFSGPSSSNNETSSTYSREELLALFRIDYPLPKEFVFHPFVISKEPLKPVAFTSPEEEEEEVNNKQVRNVFYLIKNSPLSSVFWKVTTAWRSCFRNDAYLLHLSKFKFFFHGSLKYFAHQFCVLFPCCVM